MADSLPSTTTRFARFSSSRTLPGQSCSTSACNVGGVISMSGLLYWTEVFLEKKSVSAGISSRRSRSGGRQS